MEAPIGNQIRPPRLLVELFRIYLHSARASKRANLLCNGPSRARADGVPRRSYRACANTAEPTKATAKESKITEPPHICTATPPTVNRRPPSAPTRPTALSERGQAEVLKPGLPTPP